MGMALAYEDSTEHERVLEINRVLDAVHVAKNVEAIRAAFLSFRKDMLLVGFRIVHHTRLWSFGPIFEKVIEEVPEGAGLDAIGQKHPRFFLMLKEMLWQGEAFDLGVDRSATYEADRLAYVAWIKSHGLPIHELVSPSYGPTGLEGYCSFVFRAPPPEGMMRRKFEWLGSLAFRKAASFEPIIERAERCPLTVRQRQALSLCALGKSDWEIGAILGASKATAHDHIEAAKARLGVHTRVQAVLIAHRKGWIDA